MTARSAEFAAFGGAPTFGKPKRVDEVALPAWSRIDGAFREIFERRYFTNNGPMVQQLDETLARRFGVNHAVCVTNSMVGLMIIAKALELAGEVVVPAFAPPRLAEALSWAGLSPVPCDIDPTTHMLSVQGLTPLIGARTVAICGIHLWGRPCDPDGLQTLADLKEMKLVFDAGQAVGCTHRGRALGGCGAGEVFSFYQSSVLNGADGGCITTNDAALATRLRSIRHFSAAEAEVPLRINGKMSEAQAALALLGLADLDRAIAANRRRHDAYATGLEGLPGVRLQRYGADERNNFQSVVIEIDGERVGLHRDDFLRMLAAENVFCSRPFEPVPRHANVRPEPVRPSGFAHADRLFQRLLQLPNGPSLGLDDVARLCDLVRGMAAQADRVKAGLSAAP